VFLLQEIYAIKP